MKISELKKLLRTIENKKLENMMVTKNGIAQILEKHFQLLDMTQKKLHRERSTEF